MNVESHRRTIKESLEVIKESIGKGVMNRQRTIGFHCSASIVDILEIYLHSKNLIGPGTKINHDFFSSERKALEKLPQDFENKKKIISLLVEIEKRRNMLCYGKEQSKGYVEEYLELFNKVRRVFDSMGVEYV